MFGPVPVTTLFGDDRSKQRWVPLEEVPPHVRDAVLATEDRRFYSHTGLDPFGIARALAADLLSGELRQGASTLTQQLVKNYYLTSERTFERKIREAAMSLMLDYRTEKIDLLQAYLTEVYLGQAGRVAVHGMGSAAQHYFNKSAGNLDIAESLRNMLS